MIECIKQEAMYVIKRHYFFIVTMVLLACIVVALHSNYDSATEAYESYMNIKQWYKEDGIDLEKKIAEGYVIEAQEGDSSASLIMVDNSLAYEAEELREALYAIGPEYSLTYILESIMGFGAIIVMMLSVVMATYDNKNYTLRVKATQFSKTQIYVAKQIVMFFVITVCSLLTLVIGYIGNRVYYSHYIKAITDVDEIGQFEFVAKSSMAEKIFLVLVLMFFAAELGYAIGVTFKNGVAAMIVTVLFNLFGAYLPKQLQITASTSRLMNEVFEYCGGGIIPSNSTIKSVREAITIMVVQVISFMAISFVIFRKRSAYK